MEWLRKLLGRRDDAPEARQGETALVGEADPRGRTSAEAYNTADPRDIVEEDGVAMAGPAGAPQEGATPSERRADQRDETG
jgi:hypothetical protein